MKTMAVLGGAGFLGGHLTDALLRRGYRVVCFDLFTYAGSLEQLADARRRYRYRTVDRVLRKAAIVDPAARLVILRGDTNDTATLTRLFGWCDGVFSLAGETHVDYSYHTPAVFLRANVDGVHSVLEALRAAGRPRLIHLSTDEVYGEVLRGFVNESAPLRPRNPYAATKACGDLLASTYAQVFGLDLIIARPCNLYGPRQQPNDLIPKTFAHLLQGRKLPVHGDGRHRREYLFVRDAAEMLIELFERGQRGESYNLSSHEFRSTLQVVRQVARLLGVPPAVAIRFVADRPNPDRRYGTDHRKAQRLLGRRWRLTPFADGLKEMRDDFIRRRPEAII
jgi:dTDP-glucose 4,6-dehydratase